MEDLIDQCRMPVTIPDTLPSWVKETEGEGVRIGIIDSGWRASINRPFVERGVGFAEPGAPMTAQKTCDVKDRNGHGTVCGVLAHRVAPEAKLVPIRVFGRKLDTTPEILGRAIRWGIEEGIDVLNLSLRTRRKDARRPLYQVCEEAKRRGTLVVASGEPEVPRQYPALFDNVIGVGDGDSSNPFRLKYRKGEGIECLACGEIGLEIRNSTPSYAAPVISGIAARIRSRWPDSGLEKVRSALEEVGVATKGSRKE